MKKVTSIEKKIELAQWLLDPDRTGVYLPPAFAEAPAVAGALAGRSAGKDDLALLEARLKELGLEKIYQEIELPLAPILEEMEKIGIKADLKIVEKLSKEMAGELKRLEEAIYKKAGVNFNLNSPQQLSEILFEKLKIDPRGIPRRKTGAYSTDAAALIKIKDRHPIVPLILEYREVFKIHSTYVKPLKELAESDKESRVHTHFLQTGTATGRLASENPNLQNIPILSDWGKKLREAFVAEKGFSLAAFDYSQIELRVLASVSSDSRMIEAFEKDLDIHKMTAANVFNVSLEKVTPEMRRFAKTLNFGVIYGMGPDAFAQTAGIAREEAENFINEYFLDFAEVRRWQEKTIEMARQIGYAENLNGRKRWLPAIVSQNRRIASEAERAAINMPIQSLAADIIKLAMIKTRQLIEEKRWGNKVRMLLSIHDELLFEIDDGILREAMPLIKEAMERVYQLAVPLKVDAVHGKNWAEL